MCVCVMMILLIIILVLVSIVIIIDIFPVCSVSDTKHLCLTSSWLLSFLLLAVAADVCVLFWKGGGCHALGKGSNSDS